MSHPNRAGFLLSVVFIVFFLGFSCGGGGSAGLDSSLNRPDGGRVGADLIPQDQGGLNDTRLDSPGPDLGQVDQVRPDSDLVLTDLVLPDSTWDPDSQIWSDLELPGPELTDQFAPDLTPGDSCPEVLPEAWNEVRDSSPETWDSSPETWDSSPETWDLSSDLQDAQDDVRDSGADALDTWDSGSEDGEAPDGEEVIEPLCQTDFFCGDLLGNPTCRAARCLEGICVLTYLADDSSCDDGDPCSREDHCLEGQCVPGPGCDDGNLCNGVETCDPGLGCVPGQALECDNQSVCDGVETCDPLLGCVPGEAPACDNGNPCDGLETCDPSLGCLPGLPPDCNESGDPCLGFGFCDPLVGCSDNLIIPSCNDRDPCTDDLCEPSVGCVHVFNQAPCDDLDPCTTGDTCLEGVCLGLAPVGDQDGDGWCGGLDNCPEVANPDQTDSDRDLLGDLCDPCPFDPGDACLAAPVSEVIGPEGGILVGPSGLVVLEIPPGALASPTTITITDWTEEADLPEAFLVRSWRMGPPGLVFQAPIQATFFWRDWDEDGLVDGKDIPEEDLKLWHNGLELTPACGLAQGQDLSRCDREADLWQVPVESFSQFDLAQQGCGNLLREFGEVCDTGPLNSDEWSPVYHCNSTCTKVGPHCGDGKLDPQEVCDDGLLNSDLWATATHCDGNCDGLARSCGDGNLDPREACDDNNQTSGDGCSDQCGTEVACQVDGDCPEDEAGTPACSGQGYCVYLCTPSCSGAECGDDGCGGTCGLCSEGLACSRGLCVQSLVVNTVEDLDSGSCTQEQCSLRDALLAAEANPGPDYIGFALPGEGVQVLQLSTPLPVVTQPLVLDGTSQPGWVGQPLVKLEGSLLGPGDWNGLEVHGGSSRILGLGFSVFSGSGLVLTGQGGNLVQACRFGSFHGSVTEANNVGLSILDSPDNLIGGAGPDQGNLFVRNQMGILVDGDGSAGTRIQGNLIGTAPGESGSYYQSTGIRLEAPGILVGGCKPGQGNVVTAPHTYIDLVYAHDFVIQGNLLGLNATGTALIAQDPGNVYGAGVDVHVSDRGLIGGEEPGCRNVIAGGILAGINVYGSAELRILGNYIGTNAAGNLALGNKGAGIRLDKVEDLILGQAGAGNLISGNHRGVQMDAYGPEFYNLSWNVIIQGNLIGTDATGQYALGNEHQGLELNNCRHLLVGGSLPGEGNIIGGNGTDGVSLSTIGGEDFRIQGNHIGVASDGFSPIPNQRAGIYTSNVADHSMIGGLEPGAGNLLGYNTTANILMTFYSGSLDLPILGNNFLPCPGLNIELLGQSLEKLGVDGLNINDFMDLDSGGNNLQNHPILGFASSSSEGLSVSGNLESVPNSLFRLEFYESPGCVDAPSLAQTYLTSIELATDRHGSADFQRLLPVEVAPGAGLSATATLLSAQPDQEEPLFLDTSEVGPCVEVLDLTPGGGLVLAADSAQTQEDTPVTVEVLANDFCEQGDLSLVSAQVQKGQGQAQVSGGEVTFSPAKNWAGMASVGYLAVSSAGGSGVGLLEIYVAPVNDPPDPGEDHFTAIPGVTYEIPVTANDSDPEGHDFELVELLPPTKGTAEPGPDGTVVYTADPEALGEDQFSYVVRDIHGAESTGLVLITLLDPAEILFTVNSEDDVADGTCTLEHCSLREAIILANLNPGVDLIDFDIPGEGVRTINLESPLPGITDPVIIDGSTQPSWDGSPVIHVNAGAAGPGINALEISGGGSLIRGLHISGARPGIQWETGNALLITGPEGGNIVQGCYLGGMAVDEVENYRGIKIEGSPDNLIGGDQAQDANVFGGSTLGIELSGTQSLNNVIQGNLIGATPQGERSDFGTQFCIQEQDTTGTLVGGCEPGQGNVLISTMSSVTMIRSRDFQISGNHFNVNSSGTKAFDQHTSADLGKGLVLRTASNGIVGGAEPDCGNLLSGSTWAAISLWRVQDLEILNNILGLDQSGEQVLGNPGFGIMLDDSDRITIGAAGMGNRILVEENGINVNSGNVAGSNTEWESCDDLVIQGNIIGDPGLDSLVKSIWVGISVGDQGNILIGGTEPGQGNFLAGAIQDGIRLLTRTGRTVIQGNDIGFFPQGVAAGNGRHGVLISAKANGNVIGGLEPEAWNRIGFNEAAGIGVEGVETLGNSILGNVFQENGTLPVDLIPKGSPTEGDGVTANDPLDGDEGGNSCQNHPLILAASLHGDGLRISGRLESSAQTTFGIQAYLREDCGAAWTEGVSMPLPGQVQVVTDQEGVCEFELVLAPTSARIGEGIVLTATSMIQQEEGLGWGSTSEFSPCGVVECGEVCDAGKSCGVNICEVDCGNCEEGLLCQDLVCIHDCSGCDDLLDCTVDTCTPETGCLNQPQDSLCNDDLQCTEDLCDSGLGCLNQVQDGACDDGISCTGDWCDPVLGCLNQTDNEACDDQNPCTDDVCDQEQGCLSTNLPDHSSCGPDLECIRGLCVCAPDCQARECGDNGCGGSCGQCGEHQACVEGTCVCAPMCEGLECGDDGCGGSCGQCGEGQLCQAGVCLVCLPVCEGRECGDDGCGGSCGQCPADDPCRNLCDLTGSCVNALEVEAQCDGIDDDCDGQVDEDFLTGQLFLDDEHCGSCDNDCTVLEYPSALGGQCRFLDGEPMCIPACMSGFGDANHSPGDGCECLVTGEDLVGNDLDESCDGVDGVDLDWDGWASVDSGGLDCQDLDLFVNPDAQDLVGDDCLVRQHGWVVEPVPLPTPKSGITVVMDPQGVTHVIYRDAADSSLRYGTDTGGQWTWEEIFPQAVGANLGRLVVGPGGHLHMFLSLDNSLYYATDESGTWVMDLVDDECGSYTDMDVDSWGRVHLVYYCGINNPNQEIRYSTNSPGVWATFVMTDSSMWDNMIGLPSNSIAAGPDGFVHIIYYERGNYDNLRYIKVDGFNPQASSGVTLASGGYIGDENTITTDREGRPHMAYHHSAQGFTHLYYRYMSPTGWFYYEVDEKDKYASGDTGEGSSIQVNDQGRAFISFYKAETGRIMLASGIHDQWTMEEVAPSAKTGTRLFLDPWGRQHIFFHAATSGQLMHAVSDTCLLIVSGQDSNCDGADGVDGDGDGYSSLASGGDDCADGDPEVHPGLEDPYGDGLDSDCDGGDGLDSDGDGHAGLENGGDDCDDTDPSIHPDHYDMVGDGVDRNCDGLDGVDQDQDGYPSLASGGDDCDDQAPDTWPDAPDLVGDGVDQNCDDLDGVDRDRDGYADLASGGGDCEDLVPEINPAALDLADGFCGQYDLSWTSTLLSAMATPSSGDYRAVELETDSLRHLHLAWYDAGNQDLMYGTNASGQWVFEAVDQEGDVGGSLSMKVAGDGVVHIAYRDKTNAALKYAFGTPGMWTVETVDAEGNTGITPSLAVGADGRIHAAWYRSSDITVMYGIRDQGLWAIEAASLAYRGGAATSLVLDSQDRAHILFYYYSAREVRYLNNVAGAWADLVVDTYPDVGAYISLAIDSDDTLQAAYYNITNQNLRYARKPLGGTWTKVTVDATAQAGREPDLTTDEDGAAHLSFQRAGTSDIIYATNKSGAWVLSPVAVTGVVGAWSAVAMLGTEPRVVYHDQTNDALFLAEPLLTCTLVGDSVDLNCDGVDGQDQDQDGYASEATGGGDCDDSAPQINPGEPESCDQIDNNCSGEVDEGC